ncbi:MAG: hypothetical protein IT342_08905 [Candidatus Melainabacteria bacterium]|nr:hypothetical protein [Candidatus Melainabacteria bacterium]
MHSRLLGSKILKSDTGIADWLVPCQKTPAFVLPAKTRKFLAAFMLLLICELPAALPVSAQSQAGSSASSQAGLEAPGKIGRRRRGGRGRRGYYRRQMNQANRLAVQQQMQRARELARQQQKGDQTQFKREQALARSKHSEFIKEYGTGKSRHLRNHSKANFRSAIPAVNSATPAAPSARAPSVEAKK